MKKLLTLCLTLAMLCTLAACGGESTGTTTDSAVENTTADTTAQEDAADDSADVQDDAQAADDSADVQDDAQAADDTADTQEDAVISDVDGVDCQLNSTTLTLTVDGPIMTALADADAERDGGRYADMELRLSASLYDSEGTRLGTVYVYYLCDDICNVTFSNFETGNETTGDATCVVSDTSITVTMDTAAYEMTVDDIAHYSVSLGVYMESGMGADLYSFEL